MILNINSMCLGDKNCEFIKNMFERKVTLTGGNKKWKC